jgi:hypothetical protein
MGKSDLFALKMKTILSNNRIVLLICPALFLYLFSNDINMISLNALVYRKICLREFNDAICNNIRNFSSNYSNHVQEMSAESLMWLNITFLLPAILSIIHLSSIADKKLNYKVPLVVSIVGSLAQSLVCTLAAEQNSQLCLILLYISEFVNGICGGGSLTFISACISHVSVFNNQQKSTDEIDKNNNTQSDENDNNDNQHLIDYKLKRKNGHYRSISFSICEACILVGQFTGSVSSGFFIGNKKNLKNFRNTYLVSFCIYFFVLIYVLAMFYFLNHKDENKKKVLSISKSSTPINDSDWDEPIHINTTTAATTKTVTLKTFLKQNFGFFSEIWYLVSKKRERNSRFHIISLFILYFVGTSVSMGIMTNLQYLYLTKEPIELSQKKYGLFKGLNTFARALSLLIVLPLFKRFTRMPDYFLYLIGLTSEMLNLVIFSISSYYEHIIWIGKLN